MTGAGRTRRAVLLAFASIVALLTVCGGGWELSRARTFQVCGGLVAFPCYLRAHDRKTIMWDVEPNSYPDVDRSAPASCAGSGGSHRPVTRCGR